MPSFHFNVATEGLRAGHKYTAVLGLRKYGIEIIIEPFPAEHGSQSESDLYITSILGQFQAYHGSQSDVEIVIPGEIIGNAYHGSTSNADLQTQSNFSADAFFGSQSISSILTDQKGTVGGGLIIQPWQDYVPEYAKYKVTIIVKYKDQKWRLDRVVEHKHFNPIRIIVNFVTSEKYRTEVKAKFTKMLNKYISIFARKKD